MDLVYLIDLNRRAKTIGQKHTQKRALFNTLKVDAGRHITGVLGPRGAGKTILLQQLASEFEDSFYLFISQPIPWKKMQIYLK
jgi:predicted AAA+ superfamily ATPase